MASVGSLNREKSLPFIRLGSGRYQSVAYDGANRCKHKYIIQKCAGHWSLLKDGVRQAEYATKKDAVAAATVIERKGKE